MLFEHAVPSKALLVGKAKNGYKTKSVANERITNATNNGVSEPEESPWPVIGIFRWHFSVTHNFQ